MATNKILEGLSSQLEELESMWKETKESVTPRNLSAARQPTPQPSSSTHHAPTAIPPPPAASAVSARNPPVGVLNPRSLSPAKKIIPPSVTATTAAIVTPSARAAGITREALERKPSAQRIVGSSTNTSSPDMPKTVGGRTVSPSLNRTSPGKSRAAGGGQRDSLSQSTPARSTSPSTAGRQRQVSPQRSTSPGASARKFTFEPVPGHGSSTASVEAIPLRGAGRSPVPSSDDSSSVATGQKFCHQCGFDLRTCKVPPKFCRECGVRINKSPTPM